MIFYILTWSHRVLVKKLLLSFLFFTITVLELKSRFRHMYILRENACACSTFAPRTVYTYILFL